MIFLQSNGTWMEEIGMEHFSVFPNKPIRSSGTVGETFSGLGITDFQEACRYVNELPYGYNSDRDDLMVLFKEKMGSCTTKHAVIATLAHELDIAISKYIGIYPMTEELVTGTKNILEHHGLPFLPMLHCFLVYGDHSVDLTEGNRNGKNGPVDDFFHVEKVEANISGKDEYLLYRKVVKNLILPREEMRGADLKTVLKAREEGILLLRSKVGNEGGAK